MEIVSDFSASLVNFVRRCRLNNVAAASQQQIKMLTPVKRSELV